MQLSQHVNDHVGFYSEEGKSETTILQLGGFSTTTANSIMTEGWEAGIITHISREENRAVIVWRDFKLFIRLIQRPPPHSSASHHSLFLFFFCASHGGTWRWFIYLTWNNSAHYPSQNTKNKLNATRWSDLRSLVSSGCQKLSGKYRKDFPKHDF